MLGQGESKMQKLISVLIALLLWGLLSVAAVFAYHDSLYVTVNGVRLRSEQIRAFEQQAGVIMRSGHYWYDPGTEQWGIRNGPALGRLHAAQTQQTAESRRHAPMSHRTSLAPALEDEVPLYDKEKLAKEKSRLQMRVQQIWTQAFLPILTAEEKRRLEGVQLQFPLVGSENPLIDFHADSEKKTVDLPVVSLLFFEDLSTAYAWLWSNNYSLSTIDEYVAMLKYRKASSFPDGRHPLPLPALHIPDQALADSRVDGLSLRFRNSAFAFILAHELGHVYWRHPPFYTDVTLQQAKDHETQADDFALDLLRRTATIPMGATLFFQASAYWFPNRGDYATQQKWYTYLKEGATHPLTAERLRLLARRMDAAAADFSRHEQNQRFGIEAVHFIARGIAQIATVLEDTELQRFMAKKTAQADLDSLRPRRQ